MNIAIIGTGNIGAGLTSQLAKTSHSIVIGAKTVAEGEQTVTENYAANSNVAGSDVAGAVALSEIVILAVPFAAVEDVLKAAGNMEGKVIVDVTNPLTDDFMGITLGFTTSAAETIQALTNAPVVKAFNTVFAQVYSQGPQFGDLKAQVFVAGDNEQANQKVSSFIADAGFEPVNAGGLKNARFLEPLGALNIQFGYALGRGTQIVPVWLER